MPTNKEKTVNQGVNMRKRIYRFALITLALIWSGSSAMAQCAMCRGSVESTVSAGETSMASNLNLGILYLFFTPYVMAAVIAYIWYRYSRKNVKKTQTTSHITG